MNSIIAQWIDGKVPILNGVAEACGRVHLVRPVDPPRDLPMTLEEEKNSPTEFASLSGVKWTTALPFDTLRDAGSRSVVIVGECGMGSDGFVAMQATEARDSLQWIAFFDFSNPFESVGLEKSVIRARNNLGEEWRFDRSSPWRVEIHHAS
jgi:hypothetical protein